MANSKTWAYRSPSQSDGATGERVMVDGCSSGTLYRNHVRHRPPRLTTLFQGVRPFYFVTFNTHRRRSILANEQIQSALIDFAQHALRFNIAVGRYVIMPDHIHLFVVLPDGGMTLAVWVKSLKCTLGHVMKKSGYSIPHWQEGFFDHVLRSGESYGEKWNYVRENPVRAGLVKRAGDWLYQGDVMRIAF